QKSHVYHSMRPQLIQAAARLHMGQFSMTISAGAGSVLNDNQHSRGKPFTQAGLGNFFQRAASQAGIEARLHGLRKAFCVYWAEKGASSRTMMAMAGHMTLSEVERYTRDANNTRLVKLLINDT
ncbi:tyrosine-type recombinase/integrase, partial [Roseovarius dicentrarchi]|uniref:tyrosine-type recombinase/integrase n=1 Tax=Roseovarius dicentrarchi TaxID=2250573 RepID=UPI0019392971